MSRAGEEGYALVAAVGAIAVFAAMSLSAITATRISLETGRGEIAGAQAQAAADAGIALAVHGLLGPDAADTWPIDGRAERRTFDRATLMIRIQDERGKVPINRLDEELLTRMLRALGLDGERLAIARDSLLDWTDDDDDPRPNGAEASYYAAQGITPRNGGLSSIDELARVRGFDPALVARIKTIATVDSGGGGFDPGTAPPLAVAAMAEAGAGSPEVIDRARERSGQTTALALDSHVDLVGRPLTISVDASVPQGGAAHREAVVELTGSELRPYVVRSYR